MMDEASLIKNANDELFGFIEWFKQNQLSGISG